MNDSPRLVFDTNVVVDWLVFDHPFLSLLRNSIASGTLIVLRHELSAAELERVLTYPLLKLTDERRRAVLARFLAETHPVAMPDGFAANQWQLPAGFPRCRDPDDDLFLAMTHHARADALVTRDKALLKMRKRMRKLGMTIWDVPQLMAVVGRANADASPISS